VSKWVIERPRAEPVAQLTDSFAPFASFAVKIASPPHSSEFSVFSVVKKVLFVMSSVPSSAVRIRPATIADIPAIAPVVNAAFAIETFLEGPRTDQQKMAEMMRMGEFLIAENQVGRVVASVYLEHQGDRTYLGMLAVDPSRQGTGLGRLMMQTAEERCREQGCKIIDIWVLSMRPELLPFYRNLGYVENGAEEFHPSRPLKPGVECYCIVMSKELYND
jgi:predicted N-acetyltransferase YhbS